MVPIEQSCDYKSSPDNLPLVKSKVPYDTGHVRENDDDGDDDRGGILNKNGGAGWYTIAEK